MRKSDVAATILISRLVPKKNGCQMTLHVRTHERCWRAARLVQVFTARYRLHRADPALWCVVIFASTVAVDLCSGVCYQSVILKLTVFMIMSPFLDRNDSPLFCFVLPGTDFIAQMLPLLNIMFGSSGHSLSIVNCAPHLSLLLLCSVFLQKYSLRFCLFPSIFHVARYLSVIITHTPPPPLVGKK